MKVLRVNLGTDQIRFEEAPENWQKIGGRGLVARFALEEIPATCEPLGQTNKLIWAPGLLVGHMLSSCDRISIGGKSPLTGGIKEANAGGTTGLKMVWLGIKAIVLEGGPPQDGSWKLLYIDSQGARLEAADDLVGLGLKETSLRLRERYGDKIGISAIGPAGERLYRSAGITHIDQDRNLTRISARGGMGAVMGSKHLKAVVFNQIASNRPPVLDKALFKEASRRYLNALKEHPVTSVTYPLYGTAGMVNLCNALGGMPTRGFSAGSFEDAESISGETIHDLNQSRGGKTTHACMPGCTIQCSNIYAGPDGKTLVSPLEYETIGLMGSNLGLNNPDDIARLNDFANDMGMDSIELGAAMGVAAQAGYMNFGDPQSVFNLVNEVREDTPLGRILANGPALTGKIFSIERVPVVKNQALSAYDPRAIKGTGVTYATSPQGADHTCGLTIRAKVDHTNPEGQVALSRGSQYRMAGYDTLGVCIMGGFGLDAGMVRDLVNAQYGWGVGDNYLSELGREVILMEREFNRQAGFTRLDDRLPEWMLREKLEPTGCVFDIPEDELDTIYDTL